MDYPCNVAFDQELDMMDCIDRESSRTNSFSFYQAMDTWTLSCIHRWNPLRVLTPSRRQMALANKFWNIFYFHRNKRKNYLKRFWALMSIYEASVSRLFNSAIEFSEIFERSTMNKFNFNFDVEIIYLIHESPGNFSLVGSLRIIS